jgi:hypothetical protein
MYGGKDFDMLSVLYLTDDGNYIVVGESASTDIEGCTNHGSYDYFIIKYDAEWNLKWVDMVSGNSGDILGSLLLTSENALILVGESESINIEGCINKGSSDCYIVKYSLR